MIALEAKTPIALSLLMTVAWPRRFPGKRYFVWPRMPCIRALPCDESGFNMSK